MEIQRDGSFKPIRIKISFSTDIDSLSSATSDMDSGADVHFVTVV